MHLTPPEPDPDDPERSDVGWGEAPQAPAGVGSDDWYRQERPPHHDAGG